MGSSKHSKFAHSIREFIGLDNSKTEDYNAGVEEIKQRVMNLVRNYYNLNRLALVTRYGAEYDREDDKKFIPKFDAYSSFKKTLSALNSLSYQCAEYIVCEASCHKQLELFIGKICNTFILQNEQLGD